MSYGRYPDGDGSWYLFPNATPSVSNSTQRYSDIVPEPQVSPASGFYSTSVTVSLTSGSPYDNIFYTLDGSNQMNHLRFIHSHFN